MPILEDATLESEMEQFERDMDWIYTHYDMLKREYPNEFVAVFNQAVVAHDTDIESLMASVQPRFGRQVGNVAIKFIYARAPCHSAHSPAHHMAHLYVLGPTRTQVQLPVPGILGADFLDQFTFISFSKQRGGRVFITDEDIKLSL